MSRDGDTFLQTLEAPFGTELTEAAPAHEPAPAAALRPDPRLSPNQPVYQRPPDRCDMPAVHDLVDDVMAIARAAGEGARAGFSWFVTTQFYPAIRHYHEVLEAIDLKYGPARAFAALQRSLLGDQLKATTADWETENAAEQKATAAYIEALPKHGLKDPGAAMPTVAGFFGAVEDRIEQILPTRIPTGFQRFLARAGKALFSVLKAVTTGFFVVMALGALTGLVTEETIRRPEGILLTAFMFATGLVLAMQLGKIAEAAADAWVAKVRPRWQAKLAQGAAGRVLAVNAFLLFLFMGVCWTVDSLGLMTWATTAGFMQQARRLSPTQITGFLLAGGVFNGLYAAAHFVSRFRELNNPAAREEAVGALIEEAGGAFEAAGTAERCRARKDELGCSIAEIEQKLASIEDPVLNPSDQQQLEDAKARAVFVTLQFRQFLAKTFAPSQADGAQAS